MIKKKNNKWALVSKNNSTKVLKYFDKKPTKEQVAKEEKRIAYFKHKKI